MDGKTHRLYSDKILATICSFSIIFLAVVAASAQNAASAKRNLVADFDGDGKTDISVWRPSNGYWYIQKSSDGFTSVQWGQAGDALAPGDYDGDGRTDLAVSRRENCRCIFETANTWFIRRSSDDTIFTKSFGRVGFSFADPKPADYDGDGKTDFAFYDSDDSVPSPGRFRIARSSDNSVIVQRWGFNSDRIARADYDGDGKTDIAVFRPENATWHILQSATGTLRVEHFGIETDQPVPGDYDGDGLDDIAVFRPSNGFWYRLNSRDRSFNATQFGASDDKPTPADYDGDGRYDIAVFRPSTGVWFLLRSTEGFATQHFGLADDVPIPNVYVR